MTTALPLIFGLAVLALSAFANDWFERRRGWRHVGPASDRGTGIYLNGRSPASLAGNGASSSTRQGAEL